MRQATIAAAAAAAPAGAINGIDVASFQHPGTPAAAINWASVAGAGYKFAGIKATEDSTYTNPYYVSDAQHAVSAGLYVEPYAFADPYNTTATPNGTAQQQADYAVQQAAKAESASATTYTVGGKYLPLVLDIEYDPYASAHNVDECYGYSTSAMVTWISQFTAEIQSKTGRAPTIYTTQDWWATCTGSSTAFGSDVLWVANYSVNSPALPAGWNFWNMWQYSSSGTVPGITSPPAVDLDYFYTGPSTAQTAVNTAAAPLHVQTLGGLAGNATYTATGLPPGTSISSSGEITGTPTTPGSYTVTVTPSVGGGTVSFTWTITGGTITTTSPGNLSTAIGSSIYRTIPATDATSGATLSFSATGLPKGLSMSSAGKITGWPDTTGTYHITVTETDSAGASALAMFTWTVGQAANSGPTGRVVLSNGGKCLDDTSSSTANGTRTEIWSCTGGANQNWTFAPDDTIRIYGKCLETKASGTANGTVVDISTCTGGANQRWLVGTNAELINPLSNRCLDDPGNKTANGTKLDLWACGGGTNQRWTAPAGPVLSGIAGKCVDDTGASSTNGNKIDSYACNGGKNQAWIVEPNGSVRVYGKCLDVKSSGTSVGTLIDLWGCTGGVNQQWKVNRIGNIGVELVNPHANLCLGDPADSTANGTQLQLRSCSATDPGVSWNVR